MAVKRAVVRAHFDRAANQYQANAVLQQRVLDELLSRLFEIKPTLADNAVIVDAGCGPGHGAQRLQTNYPNAQVIALDFAPAMINGLASAPDASLLQRALSVFAKPKNSPHPLCADVAALPFCAGSVDVIFSSLCIQWITDLRALFAEWRRVLKPDGVIILSSFGPDTLKELRQAWASVDNNPHVNEFIDMHDVGDSILRAGFKNPVLDNELIILSYRDVKTLMRELKAIGANNAHSGRSGLGGKRKLQAMLTNYPVSPLNDDGQVVGGSEDPLFDATYEVVYAFATAAEPKAANNGEISVPVSAIRRR
jgi:malonyl-CoA O-methyltransferase